MKLQAVTVGDLEARVGVAAGRAAPGVVVGAVWADGMTVQKVAGNADLQAGLPLAIDTPLPWFSITKLFTATAILQLAERGLLDLDEPLRRVIPELCLIKHRHEATVRHLLSHSAGLPNPIPVSWIHLSSERGPSLDEMLSRHVGATPKLAFVPGTKSAYSNLGYLVLGKVIERVTHARYEDHVREHVLSALGADQTGFDLHPGTATGYQRRFSLMGIAARCMLDERFFGTPIHGYWPLRPFAVDGPPYGGLVGPMRDLLAFARMILARGAGAHGRVLDAASVASMVAPSRDVRGRQANIGLGFHLGEEDGRSFAFHLGGGGGFRSELRVYSDMGYAVAVIGTETSFPTERFTRLLVAKPGHVE